MNDAQQIKSDPFGDILLVWKQYYPSVTDMSSKEEKR